MCHCTCRLSAPPNDRRRNRFDIHSRPVKAMLAGNGLPESSSDLVTLHILSITCSSPSADAANIHIGRFGDGPDRTTLVSRLMSVSACCVHTDAGHACGSWLGVYVRSHAWWRVVLGQIVSVGYGYGREGFVCVGEVVRCWVVVLESVVSAKLLR